MRIGFEVAPLHEKAPSQYTYEEALEYWYTLRCQCSDGEIGTAPSKEDIMTVALQDELVRRIEGLERELHECKHGISKLHHIVWDEDIPSPTTIEYAEHHASIQKILKYIDKELLKV